MKFSRASALLLALSLALAACAPSASPAQRAIDKAPFRKGELWALNPVSADGKTKRSYLVEITGTASYDAEGTEVYIDAKSDNLKALTYYDPDTEQQAVMVFLDGKDDPNIAWCDFNDARRGVTKLRGVSYFGLRSKLVEAIRGSSGLGSCTLERQK